MRSSVWKAGLAFAVSAVVGTYTFVVKRAQPTALVIPYEEPASLRFFDNSRPVYPYSVVSGGVRSTRELAWAMRDDPVVAMHYTTFRPELGRTETLQAAEMAYVSYRKGNDIFWTRNRVLLKAGEQVVTDGRVRARGRCGNQISKEKREPTLQDEPEEAYSDAPPEIAPVVQRPELLQLEPPVMAKKVPSDKPADKKASPRKTVLLVKAQSPFVPLAPPEVLIPPLPIPPLGPPEIALTVPLPPVEITPYSNNGLTKLTFVTITATTEPPEPPLARITTTVPPPYKPGVNRNPLITPTTRPLEFPPTDLPGTLAPEPGAWALILVGLLVIYLRSRFASKYSPAKRTGAAANICLP